MDVENKMVIDDYWPDYGKDYSNEESDYDWLDRIEEEEEEEGIVPFFAWSRTQDGYHF
jgi:hypothetical protein